MGNCRYRYRHDTMLTANSAMTIHQSTNHHIIYGQAFHTYGNADDIHNGIHCPYLMEMNLLHICSVGLGLSLSQYLKNFQGQLLSFLTHGTMVNNMTNLPHTPMLMMMVVVTVFMLVMMCMVMVVLMVMVMMVLMFMMLVTM